MDQDTRQQQIQEHLDAIHELKAADAGQPHAASWPPQDYYLLWHILVGMVLGCIGALVSLAANMVGAPLFGKPSLELIRVYLTFPMGERAMHADDGVILFIGCVLYLCTGAVYGSVIHIVMSSLLSGAPAMKRFLAASAIGLAMWIGHFYLILSWLQPMLLGDNWIVRLVPVWVAALTHLAFAWTVLAGESWGRFETCRPGAPVDPQAHSE